MTTRKQQGQSSKGGQDAIALLIEDHKKVQKLFKEFERVKEEEEDEELKQQLVTLICAELTIHTQIEEEIFYPAARDAMDEQDLLDEAEVEHASAKTLIAQLSSMEVGDDLYDAKVIVLGEYIDHHIKEEHDELFPKVRKAKVDIEALGVEMMERKLELQEAMGLGEGEGGDEEEATTTSSTAKRGSRSKRNSGRESRA